MDDGGANQPQPEPLRDGVTDALTPERWQQIKNTFGLVLECEPERRSALLLEVCAGDEPLRADVQSLLAAAEAGGAATSEVFQSVSQSSSAQLPPREADDPMLGRRIGSYRIERRIGYGGMASVYLASRADDEFRKCVAVKVLRPDLDNAELLRRFRNERQTLAVLDHSNIVKLLDGGSTAEGLPYLVMDYVDGCPIDEYCDAHKLTVEQRLRLFCAVCEAVRCAHQSHVIHRDLKPNNILVTDDGTTKLLDFGIAKLLGAQEPSEAVVTRTATRHLTPAYASPEQVRGEPVTEATDVYSLGVVLYELLTGHRPYRLKQRTPAEMERAICEQEPESPSTAIDRIETEKLPDGTTVTKTAELVSRTREGEPGRLRRNLRGDLDNILLKALQKERQRRYETVAAFERDIQCHLEHRPVQARPSTFAYRASKFVRRRKTEVLASATVVFILLAAVGFSVVEERRAAQKSRAELATQRSRGRRSIAVLGFKNLSGRADAAWLSTALSEMLTTELSAGGKLRTIPGESVARTKINLSLPEAESLSGETLSRVYKNLGSDFVVVGSYLDLNEPGRNVRLDLRVQDAARGETVALLAETGNENSLPDLVTRAGAELRHQLGISEISAAEAATVELSLPSNPKAARLYSESLAKLRIFDALGAREGLQQAVIADPNFALAHSALADAWTTLGYDDKAKEEARKALDLSANLPREQGLWIEGHYYRIAQNWAKASEIYRTLFNFFPDNLDYGLRLAEAQVEAGQLVDSLATIEALRKLPLPAGADPRIDLAEGEYAESATDFKREVAAATRAQQKGESLGARLIVAKAIFLQGHGLRNLYDTSKANDACERARALFAAAGDYNGEARVLLVIGVLREDQNDPEGARKAYEQALRTYHKLGNLAGEISALTSIGELYTWQKDFATAATIFQRSLALARELGQPHLTAQLLRYLGAAERQEGDFVHAKEHLQEALAQGRRYGDKDLIAWCLMSLAGVAAAEGDFTAAKKMYEEVLSIFRQIGVKMNIGGGLQMLADLELSSGDLPAARKHYSEALQIFTQEEGQQLAASYGSCGLGDILFTEGDFKGAREKYKETLAVRQKLHGDARYIFDNRIKLARLSLEEGNVSDAEAGVRQAVKEYAVQNQPDAQVEAGAVLVLSLVAQKRLSEAEQLIADDQQLLAKSEDRRSHIIVALSKAQLLMAAGKAAEAAKLLQVVTQEASQSGFGELQFEAKLALGEALNKSGKSADARSQLLSLEKDADAKGFLLIAHKAHTARTNH